MGTRCHAESASTREQGAAGPLPPQLLGSQAPAGRNAGPHALPAASPTRAHVTVEPRLGDRSRTGLSGEPHRLPRGQPAASHPLPSPQVCEANTVSAFSLGLQTHGRAGSSRWQSTHSQSWKAPEAAPCSGPRPEHQRRNGHPVAWSCDPRGQACRGPLSGRCWAACGLEDASLPAVLLGAAWTSVGT